MELQSTSMEIILSISTLVYTGCSTGCLSLQSHIGANFLHFHNLLVDMYHNELSDTLTHLWSTRYLSLYMPIFLCPSFPLMQLTNPYVAILSEFPYVVQRSTKECPINHLDTHNMNTTSPSISLCTRWLSTDPLKIAYQEFEHIHESGIICSSSSPWSSTLVHGTKDDTCQLAPLGRLQRSEQHHHIKLPHPHIQDFSTSLHGCTIFSNIDLVPAYLWMPVGAADIPKTAITIVFVSFEFLIKDTIQTLQCSTNVPAFHRSGAANIQLLLLLWLLLLLLMTY